MASPLYELTKGSPKKGEPVKWEKDQQTSFDNLKTCLSDTILLGHPTPFSPFVLDTNASWSNIGGSLQQDLGAPKADKNFSLEGYAKSLKNSQLRPIAYESRKLSKTEQNYSTQERELLAIIPCLKHFR